MRNATLSKTLLGLFLIASAATLHAQNAYIQNLALPRYIKAGINYPISLWARNATTVPYTNFSISWRVDGGTTNTGPNQGVGGGGIAGGNYLPYTHPVQLNVAQGVHTLEVWITTAVDTDPSNNTVTITFTALNNYADKVVLMEGRTETWCQYCPTANTVTNGLRNNPDFAVVKFHTADQFEFPDGDAYYGQYNVTFTPAAMLDMGEYGDYIINSQSPGWEAAMTSRAAGVSPAILVMSPALNHTTRVLTVSITAHFTYSFTGPFKLNVYVVEDLVPGPQTNGGAGNNYIHNGVMRAMLGGSAGTSGIVPNTPVVGTNYTQTYTYTVPANFKLADLRLVGVLEHNLGAGNRYCVNAVNTGASQVGISDLALAGDRFSVFPNPFENSVMVHVSDLSGPASIDLFSLDGRNVFQRNVVLNAEGYSNVDLQGAGLAEGAYLLRIVTSEGSATQRILKVD